MSACAILLPVGLTMPHFYNSPTLLAKVEGFNPTMEEDSLYLDLDTDMAVPLYGQAAAQLVMEIGPVWAVPQLNSIQQMAYPLVYIKSVSLCTKKF